MPSSFRDLKFEVKTAGGNQYVYTSVDALVKAGLELGILDDWVEAHKN